MKKKIKELPKRAAAGKFLILSIDAIIKTTRENREIFLFIGRFLYRDLRNYANENFRSGVLKDRFGGIKGLQDSYVQKTRKNRHIFMTCRNFGKISTLLAPEGIEDPARNNDDPSSDDKGRDICIAIFIGDGRRNESTKDREEEVICRFGNSTISIQENF